MNNVIPFFGYKRRSRCKGATVGHAGPFLINSDLNVVECEACDEKLNPIYVLEMMSSHETRWHEFAKEYAEAKKDLSKRTRTRCQHCAQMTKIGGF